MTAAAVLPSAVLVAEVIASAVTGRRLAGAVAGAAATTATTTAATGSSATDDASFALRLTVGMVTGITQVVGVMLVAGAVDILYWPTVLALHAVVTAGVIVTVPARPPARRKPSGSRSRRPVPIAAVLITAVLGFAGAVDVLLSLHVPSDYDDTQYHLPNAASWVQTHNLWHLPPTNPGYLTNGYPSDGELVSSWTMLPSHVADWAALPTIFFGALIIVAAALLAEEIGGAAWHGALAGGATVLCPSSWEAGLDSSLTDWLSVGGLIAGLALALHARRRCGTRGGSFLLLAGAALGLAVGSKDTTWIPTVVLAVVVAGMAGRGNRLAAIGRLAAGVIALAAVWVVRDAIQTGNPVYPEPIGIVGATIFHGAVSPWTADSTSLLQDIVRGRVHALHLWLHDAIGWYGLAALGALGAIAAVRRRPAAIVAALATAWAIAYLAEPYTGPAAVPLFILAQLRYGLPALAVALVCSCVVSRALRAVVAVAVVIDVGFVLHVRVRLPDEPLAALWPSSRDIAIAITVAVVVAITLAVRIRLTRPGFLTALALGVVSSLAVLLAAAWSRPPPPTPLDVALTRAGQPDGRVMIDFDGPAVLAAMGVHFEHPLVSAGGGVSQQAPILNRAGLDARLEATDPAAVIVGQPVPGFVAAWQPPGYRLLYEYGGSYFYVKASR